MPQMPYPKILAFVEGSMEALFINNNFHYVEVIPVSNGVGWSVPALCQQISTFFSSRDSHADAFVVWIDRERRIESAAEVEAAVRNSLVGAGAPPERIHIMISDKMSENIILSDQEFIRRTFNLPDYTYDYEGGGGKHKLKVLFKGQGITYRETKHGVASLKAIRLANCAEVSPSVGRFLQTFQMPCWWIGQQ